MHFRFFHEISGVLETFYELNFGRKSLFMKNDNFFMIINLEQFRAIKLGIIQEINPHSHQNDESSPP